MYRILMIDDEAALLLARRLFLEGKGCAVDSAQSAGEAIILLSRSSYDLILLDVRMPDVSGFDLCGQIKRLCTSPIVFLSSLTQDEEQLRGFAAGGADYIPKDCPMELFWAKLSARLHSAQGTETMRHFPPLTLDLQRQRAVIDGADIGLTQIEFSLLAILSSRPGSLWTVDELFGELWGTAGAVDAQLVQGHLSRMRRKLEKAFPRHGFLETVWGKGYQFVPMDEDPQ